MNHKVKKTLGISLVVLGIVAFIIAGIAFIAQDGVRVFSKTYGGDAYTGIQNASAITTYNLLCLTHIVKTAVVGFFALFGSIFIIAGILVLRQKSKLASQNHPTFSAMTGYIPTDNAPEASTNTALEFSTQVLSGDQQIQ